MPSPSADRNLLFGILAVQMDFVSNDQLVAGMNDWVLDKSQSLGWHLVAAHALSSDTQQLIDALVDKHVEQHGGQVHQSLAAVHSPNEVRNHLEEIGDADVQQSLFHVPAGDTDPGDSYATVAYSAAKPTVGGRFTVLRPHAAGGLGQVSIAQDAELNREVALKELLDRHADDNNSRARFLQEAEITGGLEHPGVVPIYGLGQYADGRPFYAMRFIRGDSLRQAIDQFHAEADAKWQQASTQLQLRRLLTRMIHVCNAIDYAHSRGVLHRDLKPSNVMLGRFGETLVVDWGLAKAVGKGEAAGAVGGGLPEAVLLPQSGSGSSPTQMGAAVGTPAFMSPEQAAGRLDQLGPTSDVFSLGASLYMLLTGRAPQDASDIGEVLMRVQQGLFARPRECKPAIPRPLEAICLRAMALHPNDRYATAGEMASDLEAWLADEPVAALPEPWTARTRRWLKRHRAVLTTVAGAVLAVLVSLAVGVVLLNRAKDDAVAAKDAAVAAKVETQRQSDRAEQLLELAEKSLTHYEELSQSEQLHRVGMESLRSDLLETSVEYYATLANLDDESDEARADRAHAYSRLGATYQQMGQVDRAVKAYQSSLGKYEELIKADPGSIEFQENRADLQSALGEVMVFNLRGREAAVHFAKARAYFAELIEKRPNEPSYKRRLAYATQLDAEQLRQAGKVQLAADALVESLSIIDNVLSEKLNDDHLDDKDFDNNERNEFRFLRARVLLALGALRSGALWNFDAAREHLEQAEAQMAALHADFPELGNPGYSLAQIKRNLGILFEQQNLVDEAIRRYEQGIAVLEKVELNYPDVLDYRGEMAALLHAVGSIMVYSGDEKTREQGFRQIRGAIEIARAMLARSPLMSDMRLSLAGYEAALGAAHSYYGDQDQADAHFDASLAELAQLDKGADVSIDQTYGVGETQFAIAGHLTTREKYAEALPVLDQAEESFASLIAKAPQLANAHHMLGQIYLAKSECQYTAGRFVESIKELDRVAATSATLSKVPDSENMQATFQVIASAAKVSRAGELLALRNGDLEALIAGQGPAFAVEQAEALAEYTKQPRDQYLAARILALAAQTAGDPESDEESAVENRTDDDAPTAAEKEKWAAAAVDLLRQAWQGGQIRRKARITDLITGAPSIETLQGSDDFSALRGRDDFARLLSDIGSGRPDE